MVKALALMDNVDVYLDGEARVVEHQNVEILHATDMAHVLVGNASVILAGVVRTAKRGMTLLLDVFHLVQDMVIGTQLLLSVLARLTGPVTIVI